MLSGHQTKLRILDVAVNRIQHLENLEHLVNLEEFWVAAVECFCVDNSLQANDNQLESFEELKIFSKCIQLQTAFFQRNPLEKDPQYRNKVIAYIPTLTELDSIDVKPSSLTAALRQSA